jgi:hypothetical protein
VSRASPIESSLDPPLASEPTRASPRPSSSGVVQVDSSEPMEQGVAGSSARAAPATGNAKISAETARDASEREKYVVCRSKTLRMFAAL